MRTKVDKRIMRGDRFAVNDQYFQKLGLGPRVQRLPLFHTGIGIGVVEGYGDHTGYYNQQANFPVFTIDRITMRKDPMYHFTYPGHARRVMMGVWSHLRQFMYTKFIVVVDDDVNVRDWKEVIWALTTRVDPVRDLGSKMGLDATNKWPGETQREWGRTIAMDADVQQRMDGIFEALGF